MLNSPILEDCSPSVIYGSPMKDHGGGGDPDFWPGNAEAKRTRPLKPTPGPPLNAPP